MMLARPQPRLSLSEKSPMPANMATRRSLRDDLAALGLERGDHVLVHASLRSIGPIVGGADSVIDALSDAVGAAGTILGYCDWEMPDEIRADPALRDDVPGFDPRRSRAMRENGAFPELLRTTPGAYRSANPGASCAALGGRARWFTACHDLDYGYGKNSPFARLVEVGGKCLMLGAPRDTMTLIHHAEHLARLKDKRIRRYEVPICENGRRVWRWIEEFDTADPVVAAMPDDFIARIVDDYLAAGHGRTGVIGRAGSLLVEAAPIVAFAVNWLESRFGVDLPPTPPLEQPGSGQQHDDAC